MNNNANEETRNEEIKNKILNNLKNLKEKKQSKEKQKPDNNNKNNRASKQNNNPRDKANKAKPKPEIKEKGGGKFNKLDKSIQDRLSKLGGAKNIKPEAPEIFEEPENKLSYDDFIKSYNIIEAGEDKHEIVGVRFKPVGKIYFFNPGFIKFKTGDKVLVETLRGLELGSVVFGNKLVSSKKVVLPLKPILRRASETDVTRVEHNKKISAEALRIAEERIRAHGLRMKLIDAEYTFDGSKLIYYFTHEGRVDFRELVKDLAGVFKVRIELRQIGIRDQTKVMGGLSVCGRAFCCSSFLPDFEQVTIKMAKDQNISLNSAKISGACGRLMCCLKYEHETYEQLNKDMPRQGAFVETDEGERGIVIESNTLTGTCRVKITRSANNQADNLIKPYAKSQLKVTGYAGGSAPEDNLAALDVIVEDGPAQSGIDLI